MCADEVFSYGLAWNPLKSGHVLGASEDTTVCHWYVYRACSIIAADPFTRDVNSYTKEKSSIEPTNVFRGHTSIVGVGLIVFVSCAHSQVFSQDVDWHCSKENIFGSVGDDKMLLMYALSPLLHCNLLTRAYQLGHEITNRTCIKSSSSRPRDTCVSI